MTLIFTAANGETVDVNLNKTYLKEGDGPFSFGYRDNSGARINNVITNFIKENGNKPNIYNHREEEISEAEELYNTLLINSKAT